MLKGRTILDCSTLLPGPFVGKLLAQKGARVIKVESPDHPDGARGMGAYYEDLNSCKELVLLNLSQPGDRKRFHDLVRTADGLIEGFRPKAKIKLGLDQKTLHSINPKLCIASLVGYPETGPWADRAGHDLNFQAVTGCLSLFNEMPGLPLADLIAAYEAALALVSALDGVARGGKGTRVVTSMSNALLNAQGPFITEYRASGIPPSHGKTLISGKFPCYRLYTTQDGKKISVGAVEKKFWTRVCDVLGISELHDAGYATGAQGSEVVAQIQKRFASQPWSHWQPLFEAADACVEAVIDYSEIDHGV